MIFKKNRFLIFLIFNGILLILILLLSIPISKYLSNVSLLNDNDYVKDQVIVNPKAKSQDVLDRDVTIKFVAKVNEFLDWEFEPLQKDLEIKIGENKIVKYLGKNLSNKTITSTAIFSVSPENIEPYLIKTECFCFIEQTLESGESKIFTMVFYLDPAIDSDKNFDDLKELVFTYEFSEYKS